MEPVCLTFGWNLIPIGIVIGLSAWLGGHLGDLTLRLFGVTPNDKERKDDSNTP